MTLRLFLSLTLLWIATSSVFSPVLKSQCLTIESILVDACAPPANPPGSCGANCLEGLNEMFRFRVGSQPINATQIQISWANNIQVIPFNGFIQNAQTASVTAQLNATIQSCGWLLEPPGLILPANSRVLVITSPWVSASFNPLPNLSDTMYVIYHNHAGTVFDPNFGTSVAYGHFINYRTDPPSGFSQTLRVSILNSTCNVSVTYSHRQLITQAGTIGLQDGATVNIDSSGGLTYVNLGCRAPVRVLSPTWTPQVICSNSAPLNLDNLITGTRGGVWSGQGVSGNTFNPAGLSGLIPVTYTLGSGSCDTSLTQNITVNLIGDASWTPPVVCSGETISLPPLVTGTAGGVWSGQGVSGTNFNSTGLSGNISVTYIVGTGSCRDTSTQIIQVIASPNSNWISPGTICNNVPPFDLNTYVTGNPGGTWSGQGVSSTGLFNPTGLTGTIAVIYSVGQGTCLSQTTRNITVQNISAQSISASICQGNTYRFNGTDYSQSGIYADTLQNIFGCDSIINLNLTVNPISRDTTYGSICFGEVYSFQGNSYNTAGAYNETLTSSRGCDSVIVLILSVNNQYRDTTLARICSGERYNLPNGVSVDASGVYNTSLNTNTGCDSIITTILEVSPIYQINIFDTICERQRYRLPDGNYVTGGGVYRINLQSNNGCDSIISVFLGVNNSPEWINLEVVPDYAEINMGDTLSLGTQTNLPSPLTYSWRPATGLSCYDCPNPLFYGLYSTDYQVFVSDSNGCQARDQIQIRVTTNYNIFIPNVFTPNGDGANDLWQLFGTREAIKYLNVKVFNRWGEKVFESNDGYFGWDGTYKSEPQPPGVYVFYIDIVWMDNSSMTPVKGSVTLLK